MSARYLVGDTRQVLAAMPDASVDLVLTSPPFLALRSYLPADHPDKHLEMGSELTPGVFIDGLLDVVEELRRVLAPHGSIAIELGDTYSGSGGAGGDYNEGGLREGQERFDGSASRAYGTGAAARPPRAGRTRSDGNGMVHRGGDRQMDHHGDGYPMDKSLCLIPELFRVALVYGFNPLTGRTTPRWRARNVVRWCRPNPPVGALGDKVRPATSDMVIACTARDRYFDLDAVRTPHTEPGAVKHKVKNHSGANPRSGWESDNAEIRQNPGGAPPLDHWWHDDTFDQDAWKISTQPYPGSHYATWPEALCVTPIKAMTPLKVCTTCGQPSRRTFTENPDYAGRGGTGLTDNNNAEQGASLKGFRHVAYPPPKWNAEGWSDCGHGTWRAGVVLDPFAGSGTTLQVATGHGRDAIGIDLDPRNADLATHRVGGLFLTVETHDTQPGTRPPPNTHGTR